MLRLLKVTGDSLSPNYQEGDFVLVLKIPFFFSIKSGDVIAFRHPPYGIMIKQAERISAQYGGIYVLGTHPASTDSRQFGPIQKGAVIGKVIWHIPKPIERP